MEDPPPEDPSGHPPSVAAPPQPVFADLPQPISSEFPKSAIAGGSSDQSQSSEFLCRPPLAEININGGSAVAEVVFSARAIHKKPSSVRPAMAPAHRKFKKMKTASAAPKNLSHQPPPNEELLHLKPKDSVLDDRMHLLPDAGIPAVVLPLKTVAAGDVPPGEGEDYGFSDCDEEEEDFDLEAYHVDEKKRAELHSLMDSYGVYDEEQLRLAIRRERKHQKSPESLAGIPSFSSESAPTSPSGILIRSLTTDNTQDASGRLEIDRIDGISQYT